MRTTVLFGEYDLTTDEKNRLLVPADVRRSLDPQADGEAFFVTVGPNGRIWLYPERRYEALVGQLESQLTPDDDELAFDQIVFSMASRVEWDKQGRFLLLEKYRARTGLGREVTMIGSRDHLEIWNRDEWAVRREQLVGQRTEIHARQRQRAKALAAMATPAMQPSTAAVGAAS